MRWRHVTGSCLALHLIVVVRMKSVLVLVLVLDMMIVVVVAIEQTPCLQKDLFEFSFHRKHLIEHLRVQFEYLPLPFHYHWPAAVAA